MNAVLDSSIKNVVEKICKQALVASRELATLSTEQKNKALSLMAAELDAQREIIKRENALDLEDGVNAGLSSALLDRLKLNDLRVDAMIQGIKDVIALADPVGVLLSENDRPNGLNIKRVRVPIGVVAIIYESRPNVTADSATLCLKASNAVVLRGGKEAMRSNLVIAKALQAGCVKAGISENAIQLIDTPDREAVKHLVQMEDYVSVVIPRGGESLIRAVAEMSRVPVIKHYKGVCHVFVDESADLNKATEIVLNAKCQRPGVCNAMETLLVHKSVAKEFLPKVCSALKAKGVELRGDEESRKVVSALKPATESDWYEEYLDLILSIRVVDSLDAAIDHINHYGSHHSDAIISESKANIEKFLLRVDSAAVYANASTRFTDGGVFGMGAEIGISTDKLHARGPMGLEELTTYKFVVTGNYSVRE